MTTTNFEIKRDYNEMKRTGRSPSYVAVPNDPLYARYPERNLTRYGLHTNTNPADGLAQPYSPPLTPQLTLHRYHRYQNSPVLSSSPDLDDRRVRRKQSHAQLAPEHSDVQQLQTPSTSSFRSLNSSPTQSFSLPFAPPPTFTPVAISRAAQLPSLSSTIDTLRSTPTHTPTQHGGSSLERSESFERIALAEPLRSKRKFSTIKPAKRLPHPTTLRSPEEWRVHAVIVDPDHVDATTGDLDRFEQTEGERPTVPSIPQAIRYGSLHEKDEPHFGGRKGRSVRFEDIANQRSTGASHKSRSVKSSEGKDPSLSSTFSLSKFVFPEPPGYTLKEPQGKYCKPALRTLSGQITVYSTSSNTNTT